MIGPEDFLVHDDQDHYLSVHYLSHLTECVFSKGRDLVANRALSKGLEPAGIRQVSMNTFGCVRFTVVFWLLRKSVPKPP